MSKWSNRAFKVAAALVGGFRYLSMEGVPGTKIRIPFKAHRGFWVGPMPDADLVTFLASALPGTDGVFLDVGANIGTYSAVLGVMKKGRLRGAAFEPVPTTNALLRRTLELNGLDEFLAEASALSSSPANLIFSGYEGGGNNFIVPPGDARARLNVRGTTLDAWMEAHPELPPDAIKIDVEGHELEVLKGGRATLARFRPALVIECHCASWPVAGVRGEDFNSLLAGCGYSEPMGRDGCTVDLTRCRETVHVLYRGSKAT